MTEDLNELYQQVILDHSKSPRNFHKMEDANRTAKGHNPLCGDRVTVYLKVNNGIIEAISFEGSGCAISKASASMMTVALKGKPLAEAEKLFREYHDLVTTGKVDEDANPRLAVFAGVYKFPSRVKCAILPWHAMLSAMGNSPATVTSE